MHLAIPGLAAAAALTVAFTLPRTLESSAVASPAPAPSIAAGTYQIDPVHSFVLFRVKHVGASYAYGRFNEASGSIVFDDAKPDASSVSMEVKTDSIDTGNNKRDQHLKSADFFNAKEFPTASFKSKSVKKSAKGFDVAGDLTMHGETKPVTITMEHVGSGKGAQGGEVTGFEGAVVVKRSDFGMKSYLDMLGDEVTIKISVEAAKK